MMLIKILSCLLILSIKSSLTGLIDMNLMAQNFIVETIKIDIPGYPTAFNPTIVKCKGKFLMFFRIRDPLTLATNRIGYIWLNDEFKPECEPGVLSIHYKESFVLPMTQDPRVVNVGDALYVVFNDMIQLPTGNIRRMFAGRLSEEGNQLTIHRPRLLRYFIGEKPQRHEKNWVPFEYQGQLLLSHTLNPHHVLSLAAQPDVCDTISISSADLSFWSWGELRGGTPAIKDGDEYLAFFHSSKEIHTVQSFGKKISHYVMGAYTFKAEPPFNITRISPEPIMHHTFYKEPLHNTWKPIRVVFPGGILIDGDHVWVAYGRQDHEIWIIKIDKEGLYRSLVSLNEKI